MFCFVSGGWEIIYNFVHHIMGEATKYSGVPMHIGHYCSHVNTQIQQSNPGAAGFFSPESWRMFIQSGVSARMLGMPRSVREPCCELRYIGGDGTGIGIPIASVHHIPPVWVPPAGTRESSVDWGRLDRCAIGNKEVGTAEEKKQTRSYLKEATCSGVSKEHLCKIRDSLNEYETVLPKDIFDLLECWFTVERKNDRWDPIRRLLHACSCQDSLLGVVTADMLPHISGLISALTKTTYDGFDSSGTSVQHLINSIQQDGMGPEISAAAQACIKEMQRDESSGRQCLIVFASFLQFLGALSHPHYRDILLNFIIFIICIFGCVCALCRVTRF